MELRKNVLFFYFLLLFCSFLFLPFARAENEDFGITMSEDKCQVSCYDAEEDATYTVAMSATAWINTDYGNSCGLAVYEYTYKDDVPFADYSTPIRYINPTDEVDNYGGYLYRRDEEEKTQETYTHSFDEAFLEQLQLPEYWWKLLFSGYVYVGSYLGKITAMYNHRINPCPLGTYVELHAMCDGQGLDKDEVAIACTVYNNGEPQNLKTTKSWTGVEVENTEFVDCLLSSCDAITPPSSS